MPSSTYSTMVNVACGVAFAMAIGPLLIYLFTGWRLRRDKLLSFLGPDALHAYYDWFPSKLFESDLDLVVRFKKQFNYLYGRRHYVAPALFLILAAASGAVMVAFLGNAWITLGKDAPSGTRIAAAALLGGFVWSISDELNRIRRRDTAPGDVYMWSFRLLISVPFGFAIAAVLKEDVGVPVAFLLGSFPTETLFTIGRRVVSQKLGLGDQEAGESLELQQLQSVSRTNAEHFADEGINTFAALAWTDPIDLTVRTNFDLNYVLDCVSQALLMVYFSPDKARSLYVLSLRGAQEVFNLRDALGGLVEPPASGANLPQEQANALATLKQAAQVLGIPVTALSTTLSEIAEDPYTKFMMKVWGRQ